MVSEDFWRYRVGDYRILATIDDQQILVLVVDVAQRREAYRSL
ncbi:type II toxin-antitoxin system RelE/ParE family toxin [Paenarthrobacter sp. PH39-S1]|nr:type II toxin-antitoxin system RelE/ParE family toxin [Paenarthrobacter sp. PH39-S1]MDJ0355695.1 type II toxin-antitoxin system RelE/ParE family toxin [Paenarthrobacter sp. PH39-S1]